MLLMGLVISMINSWSYGCQYERAHKKLFSYVEQSCIVSPENEVQLGKMHEFTMSHRFAKEESTQEATIETPDEAVGTEKMPPADLADWTIIKKQTKPEKLLNFNSTYYTIYPDTQAKPLTVLAYACSLVTCDYRVVDLLCSEGADPNTKNNDGLYPTTCCLKSLIRLYERRDEHKIYVENQQKKLQLLYDAAQKDSDGGVALLALDRSVGKLLTNDIRKWLGAELIDILEYVD